MIFFPDLKAAFHKLSREEITRMLREAGIEKELISAIEDIYKDTECKIKVNGKTSKGFKTIKGLLLGKAAH